jgi:glycosyltransferase involved in cell wall biosynthesis
MCVDFVSDEASMSLLYNTADLFVIPSIEDNLPNTALEAQACGVPIVGFRVGGLPEIVRDGQTGVLVTPSDAHALRFAVAALMGNSEQRSAMSKASRIRAETEFRLDLQARRYVELYAEMPQGC